MFHMLLATFKDYAMQVELNFNLMHPRLGQGGLACQLGPSRE